MVLELEKLHTFDEHAWQCSSVHFHPASNMVASGSWDRTVRIFDVDERVQLRLFDRNNGHQGPITCVRWHPNGAMLASTSSDTTTILWDASTGERMRILREHFGWVLSCSFAPDRTKLATASWDKTVRLWDPNTGELISTLRGHTKGVWACEFYPVGHTSALLATGGEDATARLWDTRSRKVALTLSGGHADAVYSVAWSNDGTLIATGSADRTVTIWDPKAGKVLRMLKAHDETVKDMVFAPINQHNDTSVLASAGGYSSILWNPNAPSRNLLAETRSHDPGKEVEAVSISYNGRLMATGGRDGKVIISKIPSLPKEGSAAADTDGEESNRSSMYPRARTQTKTAEKWISQQEGRLDPRQKAATEEIRQAMEDESASWLRRSSAHQKRLAAEKEIGPPPAGPKRAADPSRLLAERGFTKEGLANTDAAPPTRKAPVDLGRAPAEAPSPANDAEEARASAAAVDEDDDAPGFGPEVPKPAPLRRVNMLDEGGKAHPMVQAARNQQREPANAGRSARPTANRIDDMDSLMQMLRDKTEDVNEYHAEQAKRPQPRPTRVEQPRERNASVSELLDMSKPKLNVKPRVKSIVFSRPSDVDEDTN